jgi:hypothetical protein
MLRAARLLVINPVVIIQMWIRHDSGPIRDHCATFSEFCRQSSRETNRRVTCRADLNGGVSDSSA